MQSLCRELQNLTWKGGAPLAVQLFTHSDYSLLQSTITIPELAKRAFERGYSALGLIDHNTTAGHVELARSCQEYGLTPLFGLELDIDDKFSSESRLVFFAKGAAGYYRLQQLASLTPPVALRDVQAYAEDLIMLSGGTTGSLFQLVQDGKEALAKELAESYSLLFGDKWFVQLQWDTPAEFRVMQRLVNLFGVERCVAGQGVYILDPLDRSLLKVLGAISHDTTVDNVDVYARPMLSAKQLAAEFKEFPQAWENACQIAELHSFELPHQEGLPMLPEPVDLRTLVFDGAAKRYSTLTRAVRERIEEELHVIDEMGFSDYFLIVYDIVRFAKSEGIPVGPGRGSAASSVVAYCLGITEVDPVEYGLIFERFLNKARHGLPDIDLDFCYVRRGEVLEYVKRRFGPDHVALIGTYGTFGQRNAERFMSQVVGPERKGAQIDILTKRLAGLKRHFSTHASGVVVSAHPITAYQAVRSDRSIAVTHGDMHALEWQGLLKIDLLGLRTLTFLERVQSEVRRTHPDFSLDQIPLEDVKVFELLSRGAAVGIFQLESDLFQDLLQRMQPRSFAELAALLALGRPGPLSLVPQYLKNRERPDEVEYPHPILKEVLQETYGLAIYQEQVIQLGHRLGKLTRSQADLLRIAISKKDSDLINKLAPSFIKGCVENGLSSNAAQELFASIRRFAGYAFNKAHSVSYALLTWRAAYLKTHYPKEFFVCLMDGQSGEGLRSYLLECQRMGIRVLPPNVQLSQVSPVVEGDSIRLGLTAIKHVGAQAAQQIVDARNQVPFKSFVEFRRRVSLPGHTLQALVQAGALDSLGKRSRLCAQIGIDDQDALGELAVERELLGGYVSEHPASRFMTFLRQISDGLAFVAGEVSNLRESDGMKVGQLDDPGGLVKFTLSPKSLDTLENGHLAAIFGSWNEGILHGKMLFPLGPTLILLPKEDALEQLQEVLGQHRGRTPVVLRLGKDLLHILPRSYWVELNPDLENLLQGSCTVVQVFDPWHQRST